MCAHRYEQTYGCKPPDSWRPRANVNSGVLARHSNEARELVEAMVGATPVHTAL